MSTLESNISANQFITQANNAIEGLDISTDDSSADVIDALNGAFDGLDGRRVITDKYAGGFIEDVNYNIGLMDSGGGDVPEPVIEKITLPTDRTPRLLFIGNSFSLDSISYLPFILKAHGIEAIVAICFRHGKTVEWYDTVYESTTASDRNCYLYVCNNTEQNPVWHDFGTTEDSVHDPTFDNPQEAVNYHGNDAQAVGLDGTWDLISIQSFSTESYSGTNLETHFPSLVSKLEADFGSDFALGFTLPSHTTNLGTPNGIMNRTNSFVTGYNRNSSYKKIDVVFPYGTAIFNARTHEEMRSMITEATSINNINNNGVYFSGRQLFGDTLHLNEGLPCFIASLAVAQMLFNIVSNYEGQTITGNEILPAVGGVYPSGTDWKTWSENALVRNPNGLNYIYGIDGGNGSKVRNGEIGSISRQWAVWFANQAVDNPYSLVSKRIDGESTDVSIAFNASHCTVTVGTFTAPGTSVPSTVPYHSTVWVYVKPDEGYTISELYWTTAWRVAEGQVDAFKAASFSDFPGTTYKRYQFQNLRENIVIFATATS